MKHLKPALAAAPFLLLTLLLAPRAGEAQQIGLGAGLSLISSDASFNQDGDKVDREGTIQEIPAIFRGGFRLTEHLSLALWTSYVQRSIETPTGESSTSGPREAGGSATYRHSVNPKLTTQLTLGAKLDLGVAPWEVGLGELSTSNGQSAALAHLEASYGLGANAQLSAGVHTLYNLAADAKGIEVQDGLLLTPHLGLDYGVELGQVLVFFGAELRLTYGFARKLDGEAVPDSDFYLVHLAPVLGVATEFGTLTTQLSAPLEDVELGFTLLGKNAPIVIPFTISYSVRL